jgi:hypothetical protein
MNETKKKRMKDEDDFIMGELIAASRLRSEARCRIKLAVSLIEKMPAERFKVGSRAEVLKELREMAK